MACSYVRDRQPQRAPQERRRPLAGPARRVPAGCSSLLRPHVDGPAHRHPGLLGPALGNVFILYLPPLVIGRILTRAASGEELTVRRCAPYIATFAGLWIIGEIWWRIGVHFLNRTDARGIESLYNDGLERLLQKDLAFFHDSFGGALTKRLISYAKQYEEFVDVFAFQIVGNLLPLSVAAVVLWQFSPWLVVALFGSADR